MDLQSGTSGCIRCTIMIFFRPCSHQRHGSEIEKYITFHKVSLKCRLGGAKHTSAGGRLFQNYKMNWIAVEDLLDFPLHVCDKSPTPFKYFSRHFTTFMIQFNGKNWKSLTFIYIISIPFRSQIKNLFFRNLNSNKSGQKSLKYIMQWIFKCILCGSTTKYDNLR